MELPPALRQAVDGALRAASAAQLADASATLTARYRGEVRDGRWHVGDDVAALAYAAVRLPATYAAVSTAMAAMAAARPDFGPRTMLDVGAGPGTAAWAAATTWPSLGAVTAIEGSPAMARLGSRCWAGREGAAPSLSWTVQDAGSAWGEGEARPGSGPAAFDLVTCAYVLNELTGDLDAFVRRLWERAGQGLLIVEPGTPAGWRRILAARGVLIAAGADLAAPCPHKITCPLSAPDWCHFSQRVARSREHRLAKGGELGWEDEKFIYVAAVRQAPTPVITPGETRASRVLAPPRSAPGRVWLKLCQPDGSATETLVTKREGERFRKARRVDWGDRFIDSIGEENGR